MKLITLVATMSFASSAAPGWAQPGPSTDAVIHGRGTRNVVPVFTGTARIGDSMIFHSPSMSPNGYLNLVGVGLKYPDGTLHINVGPRMNAFTLGDWNAQSFLIRDTSPGFIDIQTFHSDLFLQCCLDNGNIAMFPGWEGHLSIGTYPAPNIITVRQNAATAPIADAWTTYSSRRWKTDVQPIDGALDKVQRLSGVYFNWKANGKHDLGLVAEDVVKVIPELVAFEANGIDARSVDYGRLAAVLVEAIKEQQREIGELKSQVARLKAN
jgi:endosialidase-like protein